MMPIPTPEVISSTLVPLIPALSFSDWLIVKAVACSPAFFGSVISIVFGKDFSIWRIIAGVLSGQFLGIYFTDLALHILPLEAIMSHDNAHQSVAAALGATSFAVVSQFLAAVQNGQIPIVGLLVKVFGKGEPIA